MAASSLSPVDPVARPGLEKEIVLVQELQGAHRHGKHQHVCPRALV
jgi:hypothetical protein